MSTVILTSDSKKDLDLIIKLAKKLGIGIKELSKEEIEDIGLSAAIKEGKTGEYIDTDSFLKTLDDVG